MIDALNRDDAVRCDRCPHHERRRKPSTVAPADHQLVGRVSRDDVVVLPRQIADGDPLIIVRRRPGTVGITQDRRPEQLSEHLAACDRIPKLEDRCKEIPPVDDDVALIDGDSDEDRGRVLAVPIMMQA
jgi:hypothetical protein